jgi:hypothetical protein
MWNLNTCENVEIAKGVTREFPNRKFIQLRDIHNFTCSKVVFANFDLSFSTTWPMLRLDDGATPQV